MHRRHAIAIDRPIRSPRTLLAAGCLGALLACASIAAAPPRAPSAGGRAGGVFVSGSAGGSASSSGSSSGSSSSSSGSGGSSEATGSEHSSRSESARAILTDDQGSIEIRSKDGVLTVLLDGAALPADRYRLEGDRLVLLDAAGKPLARQPDVSVRGGKLVIGSAPTPPRPPSAPRAVAAEQLARELADAQRRYVFRAEAGDPFRVRMVEPRGRIGVGIGEPDDVLRTHLDLEPGEATLVTAIFDGMPAAGAGVQRFDLIVAIDGRKPASPEALRETLEAKKSGDTVTLTLRRGEKTRIVEVPVQETSDSVDAAQRFAELAVAERGLARLEGMLVAPNAPEGEFFLNIDRPVPRAELSELLAKALAERGASGAGAPADAERFAAIERRLESLAARLEEAIAALRQR